MPTTRPDQTWFFAGDDPIRPRDFIACWLDYAHKYGMGYALTDGSIGVQFNDDNTMVLAPNKRCVQVGRRALSSERKD